MKNTIQDVNTAAYNDVTANLSDVREKSRNVLFIILPNQEVATLKHLDNIITTHIIKAHIELVCGVPAQIFSLYMPSGDDLLDDAKLTFGKDIQTGTVLRMRVFTSWTALYTAICRNDIEELVHNGGIRMADQTTFSVKDAGGLHATIDERACVALFLASHKGHLRMCTILVSLGADVDGATPFGRTSVHAAASQDNLHVVQELINHGADHVVRDFHGKLPLEIALEFGAYTCETWLRLNSISLCGNRSRPNSHKANSRCNRPSSGLYKSQGRPRGASTLRQSTAPGQVYFAADSRDVHMVARNSSVTEKTDYRYPYNDSTTNAHYGITSSRPGITIPSTNVDIDESVSRDEHPYRDPSKHSDAKVVTIQVPHPKDDLASNSNGLMVPPTTPRCSSHTLTTTTTTTTEENDQECRTEVKQCVDEAHEDKAQNLQNDSSAQQINTYNFHTRKSATRPRASSARTPSVRYTSAVHRRIQNSRRPHTALPQSKTINTWMEGRARSAENDTQRQARIQRNKTAFNRWLARKRREADRENSDDEDGSEPSSAKVKERLAENEKAYNKWLNNKEEYFENLRQLKIREQRGEKSVIDDSKRMTIFQLENTDPEPIVPQPPDEYAHAFHNWLRTRKSKNNPVGEQQWYDSAELQAMQKKFEQKRRRLLTEAITYEEWLDLKSEEESLASRESDNNSHAHAQGKSRPARCNNGTILCELNLHKSQLGFPETHTQAGMNHTPRIFSYKNWTYNKKHTSSSLPTDGRKKKKVPTATLR